MAKLGALLWEKAIIEDYLYLIRDTLSMSACILIDMFIIDIYYYTETVQKPNHYYEIYTCILYNEGMTG